MNKLTFVKPVLSHKNDAEAFKQEFFDCGETIINGSALLDQMEYDEWLVNTDNNRSADTVRNDWVVADTFFAVRKSDNKIVGIIDIRHNLNNEFLTLYGGHIGYAVRPCERKKGYASEMLGMACEYAKSLGLDNVMLGCYSDNTASVKTIEKCGGILTEQKPYADGKPMRIYHINLK